MIYFMQATGGGLVKIGYTDHLNGRRQLERHYGERLLILATMGGGPDEEREIHARFGHLRVGETEQFHPNADLLAFIGNPSPPAATQRVSAVLSVKLAPVKLHMDVIEAARIVSAYRNETITDMLSTILRPVLAKMEQEEIARRTKAAEHPKTAEHHPKRGRGAK